MDGSALAKRPTPNWEARRAKRIYRMRLVMAGLSGIGLCALIFGPGTWTGGYLPAEAADKIKDVLGPLRAFVPPRIISATPIWLLIGVIGCGLGWKMWKAAATTFVDRFLQEFNDQILTRVSKAKPFDPFWGTSGDIEKTGLPWDPPVDGARRAVWDGLLAFARSEGGAGRNGLRRHDRGATTFSWTLVAGMTGMGKSRFALEIAQRLEGANRSFGRFESIGIWARTNLPFLSPSANDPFDCGWLRPFADESSAQDVSRAYAAWLNRREAVGGWLKALSDWRPRRPTLLLLDDPLIGSAVKIIETISEAHHLYCWPVRLIIIHPTVPLELALSAMGTPSPRSTKPHFAGQAFVLGVEPGMSGVELVAVRNRLPDGARLLSGAPALQQFRAATRGIPLFVELGVEWLRRGLSLSDMNSAELIEDRAERLIDAFKAAGLTDGDHLLAIACATIAGGGPSAVIERAFAKLPLTIPERRHFFPSEMIDLATTLPPIRPRAIGAAFVRRVLRDYAPTDADAEKLVRTAWAANPVQTLESVLHLGHVDDVLGRALASDVPQQIVDQIGSVEIALVFAQRAIQIPRDAWLAEDYPSRSTLVAPTLRFIAATEPEELDKALERFLALGEPETALVRGNDFQEIFGAVIGRSAEALTSTAQGTDVGRFFDVWHRWIAVLGRWSTYNENGTEQGLEGLVHRLNWVLKHCSTNESQHQLFAGLERVLDLVSSVSEPKSGFRPECCGLCARVFQIQKVDPPLTGILLHAKAMAIRARLVGEMPAMLDQLDILMNAALDSGREKEIGFALQVAQDCLRYFPDETIELDLIRVYGRYTALGGIVRVGMAMIAHLENVKAAVEKGDFAQALRDLQSASHQAMAHPAPFTFDALADCYSLLLSKADVRQFHALRADLQAVWLKMPAAYGVEQSLMLSAMSVIRLALADAAFQNDAIGILNEEAKELEKLCYQEPGSKYLLFNLLEVLRIQSDYETSQDVDKKMRFWLKLHTENPSFAVQRIVLIASCIGDDKIFSNKLDLLSAADAILYSEDFKSVNESKEKRKAIIAVFKMYYAYSLFVLHVDKINLAVIGCERLERINRLLDIPIPSLDAAINSIRSKLEQHTR